MVHLPVGQNSVFVIATRYGLDGRAIESGWGRDFPHPSTQPPRQWVPDLPEVKRPGRGVGYPTASSAEAKETAEQYLYLSAGPSRTVPG
jgi:hypothetical protein